MGMAASQARYLALTARKSNVEFQGQQINQQRTLLSVEQSELFSELTSLKNPETPSILDYEYDAYTFKSKNTSEDEYEYTVRADSIKETEEEGVYEMEVMWVNDKTNYTDTIKGKFTSESGKYTGLEITDGGTNAKIQTGVVDSFQSGTWTDNTAYNEAMTEYNAETEKYNAEIQKINMKSEQIQLQDRTLELKLRNLDTEQNAIQTELESVKKVIEDTVKNVFKTFQSS